MDDAWLDLVRVARDLGDVSSLFPPDIDRLYDLPAHIQRAIVAALAFLSFEELPKKERPPKAIWLHNKRMKRWFDEVERKRKEEMEGKGGEDWSSNPAREQLLIGFDED